MTDAKKILHRWARLAIEQGWTVKVGNHMKWYRPDGSLACTTSGTPTGHGRSLENARANLRRAGLDI
jgi:hypothetical protein